MNRHRSSRNAFSLFEVVISLTILAISAGMLAQLLESARLGSTQATRETEALVYAESILAELVASQTMPGEVAEEVLNEDPQWTYSVSSTETDWTTLFVTTVRVKHLNSNERIDADVSLTRYLYVPEETEVAL